MKSAAKFNEVIDNLQRRLPVQATGAVMRDVLANTGGFVRVDGLKRPIVAVHVGKDVFRISLGNV